MHMNATIIRLFWYGRTDTIRELIQNGGLTLFELIRYSLGMLRYLTKTMFLRSLNTMKDLKDVIIFCLFFSEKFVWEKWVECKIVKSTVRLQCHQRANCSVLNIVHEIILQFQLSLHIPYFNGRYLPEEILDLNAHLEALIEPDWAKIGILDNVDQNESIPLTKLHSSFKILKGIERSLSHFWLLEFLHDTVPHRVIKFVVVNKFDIINFGQFGVRKK